MLAIPVVLLFAAAEGLSAVGVVVATPAEASSAVLASGGHTRVVAVGEKAFGARLVKVTAEAVVVDVDGSAVELRIASAPTRQATSTATRDEPQLPASTAGPAPPSSAAPQPLTFDKADVQRRIVVEAPRILAETTATPYYQDGQVGGVSLSRVAEGTIITDAGLRAGDVLVRLNGTQIDGVPSLIGLWGRLQSENQLRAEILRGGEPVTLTVILR
jgi:type II secretion system protein C